MKRLPLLLRALGAYFGGAATLLYPPLIAAHPGRGAHPARWAARL